MANKTTNLGLTKPTSEEFYDVGVQNANMDILDEELAKKLYSADFRDSLKSALKNSTSITIQNELDEDGEEVYRYFTAKSNDGKITNRLCSESLLMQNSTDGFGAVLGARGLQFTTNVSGYKVAKITGLAAPTADDYAANKKYVDDAIATVTQKIEVDTTSTAPSYALDPSNTNVEKRYLISSGLTSITLTKGSFSNNTEYHTTVIFKSGTTATTITNTAGVYFTGDDCDGGVLTPVASKVYELGIWWNGFSLQGVVRGV